jgi:hypothetical protein
MLDFSTLKRQTGESGRAYSTLFHRAPTIGLSSRVSPSVPKLAILGVFSQVVL